MDTVVSLEKLILAFTAEMELCRRGLVAAVQQQMQVLCSVEAIADRSDGQSGVSPTLHNLEIEVISPDIRSTQSPLCGT